MKNWYGAEIRAAGCWRARGEKDPKCVCGLNIRVLYVLFFVQYDRRTTGYDLLASGFAADVAVGRELRTLPHYFTVWLNRGCTKLLGKRVVDSLK
jgi:hypothetical protein